MQLFKAMTVGLLFVFSQAVLAVPTLQLDIEGGYYEEGDEESIVTTDSSFTLYAYATPGNVSEDDILMETYYLSVAIIPKGTTADTDFGTFEVDSVEYDSGDMTYGTPPATGTANPYLASHDVYETLYLELDFMFDVNDQTDIYNTQDDAGAALFDPYGSDMLYKAFEIDLALFEGYDLHFDLYNTKVKRNSGDITVDKFAPFSHDARTRVPEPSSLVLLGLALAGMGFISRVRKT